MTTTLPKFIILSFAYDFIAIAHAGLQRTTVGHQAQVLEAAAHAVELLQQDF
jgi:hypothetical protein